LDVFDRFNDRGSDDGGKGFAVNFDVSINLKGTNPKLIYLEIKLTIFNPNFPTD
jgi:hypothetical protein